MGLSLFDLILLAQVVHEHAPIYGLFDNQCYMFSSVTTIFDAIVQLRSVPSLPDHLGNSGDPAPSFIPNTPTRPVPAPTREVGAPGNANLVIVPSPDLAGRWSGLLILDPIVKAQVVAIVISKFQDQRALYITETRQYPESG